MDHQQWSLRFGTSVIICALLLRLTATGFFQPVAELLAKPNIASLLIYLETGRIVRFSPSFPAEEVFSMESHAPETSELIPLPVFSAAEGAEVTGISVKIHIGKMIDDLVEGFFEEGQYLAFTAAILIGGYDIGVFVFAGYQPATSLVKDVVELDEAGYVVTDRVQKTNVDGIYAAGDVCIKPLRQVVTAVGDGALAATELEKYVAAVQQKTGLHGKQPISKEIEVPSVAENNSVSDEMFTADMKQQLAGMFGKMQNGLILKLYLDNPS